MTESAAEAPSRPLVGIGWMIATTLFFVAVTGVVRHLGSDMPAAEAAFIRYAIGLLMVLPALRPLITARPSGRMMWLFAIRGSIHGIAVILWFFAMARVPIALVTAIGYTAPLFVTIGAALFLGEKLHIRRIVALTIGFVGVLIIIRPGIEAVGIGELAQLAAAPLFATSFLFAKRLTREADPGLIVAMLSVYCTLILLPFALYEWRQPTIEELGWLTLTAFFATAGHYTMTRALRAAPITLTQPIGFLQLVWAAMLGIVAFGEPVDPFVILGGGIVVAAATYISHRETRMAQKISTPPPPAVKS